MTAVVGILNKQAVALAADSAVTIDSANGHKILNKANKVFTLSKVHPVGIMIHNSADFMGTPWETIIKIYRKQIGERSFPKLKDYQVDFIDFLRLKNFYSTSNEEMQWIENFAFANIDSIISSIARDNPALIQNATPDNRRIFLENFENELDSLNTFWSTNGAVCKEFVDFTFERFETITIAIFERLITRRFSDNGYQVSEGVVSKIKYYIFHLLRSDQTELSFTGLVFTGFGEDEIYPQLVAIEISNVLDNRLRYHISKFGETSITNAQEAAVCPFAQTDVIMTILAGVDPSLERTNIKNVEALLVHYNNTLLSLIGNSNPLLSEQIRRLDIMAVVGNLVQQNQKIQIEQYIQPMLAAVGTLSKDDLAEMAESLIYLTYLKRRITFAEESVGGPVDVAVISKGDGFVWIKRKHYFKPELNQHFFDNYLRH